MTGARASAEAAVLAPDQAPGSVAGKIKRNAIFNALRMIAAAPIPLVLTPYIIARIGAAGFGVWAVFFAICNLTSLADFGLVGTLSKHVAEYHARNERERLNALVSTGVALFAGIAGATVLVLLALQSPLQQLVFRSAPVNAGELRVVFYLLLGAIACNILSFPFSSIATGLQRMDITSLLSSANMIFAALFSFIFLAMGQGLKGLMAATLLASAGTLLATVRVVVLLLPSLRIARSYVTLAEARKIFRFGAQVYVVQMAVAIQNQLEKFLLARMVGVLQAGWYEVAGDVSVKVRGVPSLMLAPLLAASSELHARGDENRLQMLYARAHKYLAMVGIPLVVWVVVTAPAFVQLWLGPAFRPVVMPLCVLVVVQYFNLCTGPGALILFGKGYLRPQTLTATVGLILNVALSSVFIWRFGFAGAFIGTAIAVTTVGIWYMILYHRKTRHPFVAMARAAYLKPIICSTLLAAVINRVLAAPVGWFSLILQTTLFGALYFGALVVTRFFDGFDVDQIASLAPFAERWRGVLVSRR